MSRTEYYDDPNAPQPNSIVVAATAFVQNKGGQVLMIQRSDNGLWAIPGGGQDFGEFIAETAVRETLEETGISIRVTGLVGLYTDPRHVMAYTDGEVRQQFSICFRAEPVGGQLHTSPESPAVRWVAKSELDELEIHPSIRLRIDHGFAELDQPYIG
ncbi:putative hydrolase [Nocardia brasiliensis NBRC 14402]|uniref:NUDIX hydrolase n=1 Tax=Nocardia brasiliensis TaxID=37326 RepID=UPI00031A8B3D|nr:NUDIX domain-containing protein [Nocardia brasiliensis]ASF09114.1 NUDIX domain-containing protein [Nocardia brasiliensis]GAJ83948.1 putative hydrolase [Nocardia brasiliensis NBRC 14402]SUB40258.1 NUDIX domain [Nocardia brasiliensis]